MRTRQGISPFLATIVLVVITMTVGGIMYTQLRTMVVSQVRSPSLILTDTNVAPDGQTIVLTVKNDGNVQLTLDSLSVSYGPDTNTFVFGTNQTDVIAPSSGSYILRPGELLTAQIKSNFTMPVFSSFTLTIVSDQVARAFNVQA